MSVLWAWRWRSIPPCLWCHLPLDLDLVPHLSSWKKKRKSYIVHRIKNCSSFLHSPTGYEKPEGNCTGNIHKILQIGWLARQSNISITRPYFPSFSEPPFHVWWKKYLTYSADREGMFHVKCIPWHLAKNLCCFQTHCGGSGVSMYVVQ